MKTKSVTLFYELTQTEVKPPAIRDLEKKDRWIRDLQKTVEADWKPLYVKVKYEIHNPEVERQRRFFHTCVKWYAIQNEDMTETLPSNELLRKYREEILDELLGYDLHLVNRTVRRRKSTADFKSVQSWNKLLKMLEETLFESAGYEFPNSEEFWQLVKEHGYNEADRISTQRLQTIIRRKQESK